MPSFLTKAGKSVKNITERVMRGYIRQGEMALFASPIGHPPYYVPQHRPGPNNIFTGNRQRTSFPSSSNRSNVLNPPLLGSIASSQPIPSRPLPVWPRPGHREIRWKSHTQQRVPPGFEAKLTPTINPSQLEGIPALKFSPGFEAKLGPSGISDMSMGKRIALGAGIGVAGGLLGSTLFGGNYGQGTLSGGVIGAAAMGLSGPRGASMLASRGFKMGYKPIGAAIGGSTLLGGGLMSGTRGSDKRRGFNSNRGNRI